MGESNDQALTVYIRNKFKKKEKKEKFHHKNNKDKKTKKKKRDVSNVQCYTCDEKGHLGRDCPVQKRRHHDHISKYDESTNKKFKQEKDD